MKKAEKTNKNFIQAGDLKTGDCFKLNTIKPYQLKHKVVNIIQSIIDPSTITVVCEDKRVCCHKTELVIVITE
ncbi:MAG: hypothetical protein V4549_03305 [Bacteroidota bacterium]